MKAGAKISFLALVAAVVAVSPAFAGSLSADLTAAAGTTLYTDNLNVRFLKTDVPSPSWNVVFNIAIGKLNWSNVQVPGALGIPFAPGDPVGAYFTNLQNTNTGFVAFCIEGTQPLAAPTSANWQTTDLQNAPNPGSVGLIGGMGATRAGWINEFWNDNIASVTDSTSEAAFQLGLWGILYNAGTNAADLSYFDITNLHKFDMSSTNKFQIADPLGQLQASGGTVIGADPAVVEAAKMLANVDGTFAGTPDASFVLMALTDPCYQDQIVGFNLPPTGGLPPVAPLPAALPAGLSLLGAMGLLSKIRKR